MSLPIAILVGGLATRMAPITQTIPKSLIQVAGDFFIAHQLRYLQQQGLSKVVLCVGHLGEQIQAVVGDGAKYSLDIHYSWDRPHLLGTGGALKNALPLLGEAFFVLYGDSYLPIDFSAVARRFYECKPPALMTVLKNTSSKYPNNVVFHAPHVMEYNKDHTSTKMQYIDYGLGILSSSVFNQTYTTFDLAQLYQQLAQGKELMGFEVLERFYEIGSLEGLKKTHDFLMRTSKTPD